MGGFVRIDMESSAVYGTDSRAGDAAAPAITAACGTVIQAYLRRSASGYRADCERERIRVRLCKGAYLEPPEVAFAEKVGGGPQLSAAGEDVCLNAGEYPAIATHDERIIAGGGAFRVRARHRAGPVRISDALWNPAGFAAPLVKEGYRLRLYVPFGEAWYPYFMRRLAERPANLLFFLRNLFRRIKGKRGHLFCPIVES